MELTIDDYIQLVDKIKMYQQTYSTLLKSDMSKSDVPEIDSHELKLSLIEGEIDYLSTIKRYPKDWCNGIRLYEIDPVAFIEREVKIFNQDWEPAENPFHLFKYQRDFINDNLYPAYLNKGSLLDEKTRQMGMSWIYAAFALWGMLFDRSFTGFMLSKVEYLVDDGGEKSTLNSLFGKIKYMYDTLSDEFMSFYTKVYGDRSIDKILTFKHLRIVNTITRAYLVGSSANIDAGRGGSYKFAFWDETAGTPKSEQIYAAFKLAGRCKCYNSTVRGRGNVFARLRWDETHPVKVVSLHWSQHPERVKNLRRTEDGKLTSDWYANECKGLTESQIGQELDIDYEISVEGRIYKALDRKIHHKDFEWCEEWKDRSIISWDLGVSDEMFATVFQADNQGEFVAVDELCGEDKDIRFYIDLIMGVRPAEFEFMTPITKKPYEDFLKRAHDREYRFLMNVAGADVLQRSVTSKRSVMKQFTTAGQLAYNSVDGKINNRRYINLRMTPLTGFRILDRITEVKRLINPNFNKVIISTACPKLWERLVNYKWCQDPDNQNKETPDHNWASHGADSFGYGILYYMRKIKVGSRPGDTQIKKQSGIFQR